MLVQYAEYADEQQRLYGSRAVPSLVNPLTHMFNGQRHARVFRRALSQALQSQLKGAKGIILEAVETLTKSYAESIDEEETVDPMSLNTLVA